MRIVVAVDRTRHRRDVIGLAEALLGTETGNLLVAHVYPPTPTGAVGLTVPRIVAQDYLEGVVREIGRPVSACAVEDISPARALHGIAEETAADLIVVGSSRRGRFGRLLLGNDAAAIVHGAPCPVAVAPDGWRRARRIETVGVAFDGSAEASEALVRAERVARASDACLRLLHVVTPPAHGLTDWPSLADWPMVLLDGYRQARSRLDPVLDVLGGRGDLEIRMGDPVEELAAASAHVDVIVVGSRSRGALRRVLAGSTTSGLLHRVQCPLVIVPRPAERRTAAPDDWSPVGQLLG